MSGGVNNDAGVTALAAVTLWLAARTLRRGVDWRSALPLGVAAGLIPLFKATGIALYPAIAIAVAAVVLLRRDRRALAGVAALVAGLAAARLGIFAIDRLVTPVSVPGQGEAGLAGASGVLSTAIHSPTLFLSYLWQTFLPRLPFMTDFFSGYSWPAYDTYVEEGFASFGWYAMEFAPWVYKGIVVALAAVCVAAVAALWQQRRGARAHLPQLALVLLAAAGVLGGVTAAYLSATPRAGELPEQGRYAFTALPAFAAIAACACLAVPRRMLGWAAGGLVTGMVALEWASQFLLVQRFYL
jgi:4-amino-4-deoxy-L-arabinose transferase-like glycosyltransferase